MTSRTGSIWSVMLLATLALTQSARAHSGDVMIGLLDAGSGSAHESWTDFAMPSTGAAAVQWRHTRSYDQIPTSTVGDTVQGINWFHPYLQSLSLTGSGGTSDLKDVTWRSDACQTHTFPNTASWTYGASKTTLATLTRNHAGDPSNTYRIEFPDGTLYLFHNFDASNSNERGKLRAIKDVYGNELAVTYQGGNTGKIDYITDPSGHYFRYTYLTSGDNNGRLDYIRVAKGSGTSDADIIARIEFTYKASGDGLDADTGTTGDLLKVVVKTHKTDEVSSTFSIQRTQHYRYWVDADSEGDNHELKMIMRPEHFRLADVALSDPLTSNDAAVDDFASYYFEYNGDHRVSSMTISSGGGGCGGGCGGGGGGGTGTFTVTYTTQASSDRNDWELRTKVVHNGWTRYVGANLYGETYFDVLLTDDADHSKPLWGNVYERDDDTGQVLTHISPAAISDFNSSTNAFTYVNDGQVFDYTYDSSAKQIATARTRKYSEAGSAAIYTGKWTYAAAGATSAYRNRYLLTESHAYPTAGTNASPGDIQTTQYTYYFYSESDTGVGDLDGDSNTSETTDRVKVVKVTHPTVTTGQNGPNVAAYDYRFHDTKGRVRWTKDAEGIVSYQSYSDANGALTYSVRDVYTSTSEGAILPTGITSPDQDSSIDIWADWTGAAPVDGGNYSFQVTGTDLALKIQSKRLMDLQGRLRRDTNNAGVSSYYAHLDAETRHYGYFDGSTDKPRVPVQVTKTDHDGRVTDQITVNPSTITFADPPNGIAPPDGVETLTDQTKWVSWSKTTYDSSLRRSTSLAYHVIPSSGSGSSGTNYYQTAFTYADSGSATSTVQVRDPEGGYTKTTTNAKGQTIKVEGTATESMGSPSSWKTLTEYYYDQATPGSGSSKGGNGLVTQVKSYYADASSNSTAMTYDWRGRQIFNSPPDGPKSLSKYDNLGRVIASGQYSNGTSLTVTTDPTSSSSGRLALSETAYNNRGQVYQTKVWEINESTGATDSSLVTNTYYDRVGRVVASKAPGSGYQVTKYDGAGRPSYRYTCFDLGTDVYDSGAVDYADDNVVEYASMSYTSAGDLGDEVRFELLPGATAYIDMSLSSNVLYQQTSHWYDKARRRIQTTQFGTGKSTSGGGGMSLGMSLQFYNENNPTSRNASFPYLHTEWAYNDDGRVSTMSDVEDKDTTYEYDALGRRTATVEDSATLARRTETTYNGNSDVKKSIAKAVNGVDQQTENIYGHAINSRWVTEIRYPDASTGSPSTASADKVSFTYNNDGSVATRTDRNGSVLTYDYDTLRRKIRERVTTVGSGVDNAIVQIVTTFDSSGRVQKLTSRDSSTADSGNVVNEVKYTYNGYGQLTKDEQEHAGAVTGGTLNVQYAYTESSGDNHSRLSSITYPNARDIFAKYTHSDGSGNKQAAINNAFSRIGQWAEDSGSPGDVYVEYTFTGLSRLAQREHPTGAGYVGNGTVLNYDTPGSGDSANDLAGLDSLGRVVKQKTHTVGDTTAAQADIEYRPNFDGSPKFADNLSKPVAARSNLYTYDGLHRTTQVDTGVLNSGRTDVLDEWSDPSQTVYTMDIQGKPTTINRKNSGTSASETRAYNAQNELTSRTIAGEAPRYWVDDNFADNDTVGWAVPDINTGGSDGTWAAGSGALACSAVCTPTGHTGVPDNGQGSILLIDKAYYQDVYATATGNLSSGADNCGIVFGYRDRLNFFVLLYSKASQTRRVYEVSAGAWTQRSSVAVTITAGVGFSMGANLRAGLAQDWAGTVPAGQIGLWSSHGTANTFDNFSVRDVAGPFEVDGRWFCEHGEVQVDAANSNVLEVTSTNSFHMHVIRRGMRAGKYVATARFKWNGTAIPGMIARWIGPGDSVYVGISPSDGKARLFLRESGAGTTLSTSGTVLSLTTNNWYTMKLVIGDDLGNSALQRLRFWVDTDDDGDWSDETALLDSTAIDDEWSAGSVGFYRGGAAAQQYDTFRAGYDNNADLDIDDGGDDVLVSDDFATNVVSPTYDNNGNNTFDGVYSYTFDGWNRRRLSKLGAEGDAVTVQDFAWYPTGRMATRANTNLGVENIAKDGGNITVRHYFAGRTLVEERNGSAQATRQYLWSSGQLVWMDTNGDPSIGNDANPDNAASGEGSESPADKRHFYTYNAQHRIVALTDYTAGGGGNNGRIAERVGLGVHGSRVVLSGTSGDYERSSVQAFTSIGSELFGAEALFREDVDGGSSYSLAFSDSVATSGIDGGPQPTASLVIQLPPDSVGCMPGSQAVDGPVRPRRSLTTCPTGRCLPSSFDENNGIVPTDSTSSPSASFVPSVCCGIAWCPTTPPVANRCNSRRENHVSTEFAICSCGYLCKYSCLCSNNYQCRCTATPTGSGWCLTCVWHLV